MQPSAESPRADAVRDATGTARIGLWIIAIGLGGFFLWASLAPLAQGIAGNGTVVVAGERKTVQSLSGGAINKILVREGDHVSEGQLLLQLNTVQAQSQLDVALGQWFSASCVEARLAAESQTLDSIQWPQELLRRSSDQRAKADMAQQATMFETRRAELESRLQIMHNASESLQEQLAS